MKEESQSVKLTTKEQALLVELLDGENEIEAIIPADIGHDLLWEQLRVCCKAITYLERTSHRIMPIIGRMLNVAQKNPEFYTSRGFKTFEQFLVEGVCATLGLSRSNVFMAKRLAEAWPSMTPETYQQIGPVKLNIITGFTSEKSTNSDKYIEKAKTMTVRELKTWAEDNGLIEKGEMDTCVITIFTKRSIADTWKEFIESREVQAFCETADPGNILLRCVTECALEWAAQVNAQEKIVLGKGQRSQSNEYSIAN